MTSTNAVKAPWYTRTWFTIIMLFVFAPIGCFLLWKYRQWSVVTKAIVTVVVLIGLIDAFENTQSPAPPVARSTETKPIEPKSDSSPRSVSVAKQPRSIPKPSEKKASVSDFYTALDHKNTEQIRSMLKSNPKLTNMPRPVGDPITPMEYALEDLADAAEDKHPLQSAKIESVINVLLSHGANVNAQPIGAGRQTALHYAASGGYADIVRLLIAHGADVNATDNIGNNPLHLASSNADTNEDDRLAVAKILIAHGADVNAKIQDGDTPLHLAADGNQLLIARFLISKGAEVNATGAGGETPLAEALDADHKDMADLLRRHGGHG